MRGGILIRKSDVHCSSIFMLLSSSEVFAYMVNLRLRALGISIYRCQAATHSSFSNAIDAGNSLFQVPVSNDTPQAQQKLGPGSSGQQHRLLTRRRYFASLEGAIPRSIGFDNMMTKSSRECISVDYIIIASSRMDTVPSPGKGDSPIEVGELFWLQG